MDGEPPDWAKRNIAFFQRLQDRMDDRERRHPIVGVWRSFLLVAIVIGSLISAFAAKTLFGHVWGVFAAVALLAALIYDRKRRRTEP
jgi:hypothetical protein